MNKKEKLHLFRWSLGGGRWIRTTEGIASRFTVCPLWPLGNAPIWSMISAAEAAAEHHWSWWTESNHQPADYKSAALPLSHTSDFRTVRLYHNRKALSTPFFTFFKIFFRRPLFIIISQQKNAHPCKFLHPRALTVGPKSDIIIFW